MSMTNQDPADQTVVEKLNKHTGLDKMEDVSSFQQILMFTLADIGSGSGQTIKEQAQKEYGYSSVNHGRLYPNLDRLVDDGLVNRGQQDRRTNDYSLTPKGIEYLRILADQSTTAHKAAVHGSNTDLE